MDSEVTSSYLKNTHRLRLLFSVLFLSFTEREGAQWSFWVIVTPNPSIVATEVGGVLAA